MAAVNLDRLDRAGRLVLLDRLDPLGRKASGERLVPEGLPARKASKAPLDLQGHLDRLAKRAKRAQRGLLDLQVKRVSKGPLDLKAKWGSRDRPGLLDRQVKRVSKGPLDLKAKGGSRDRLGQRDRQGLKGLLGLKGRQGQRDLLDLLDHLGPLDLQRLLRPILRGHRSSGNAGWAPDVTISSRWADGGGPCSSKPAGTHRGALAPAACECRPPKAQAVAGFRGMQVARSARTMLSPIPRHSDWA